METIGERIRRLRHNTRDQLSGQILTGTELAAEVGITQAYQSAIECNKRRPSRKLILKYAEYFNVSLDYLMGYTNSPFGTGPGSACEESPTIFVPFIYNKNVVISDDDDKETSEDLNKDVSRSKLELFPIWDHELARSGYADSLRAMRAEGDSMEPQVHHGDVVIYRRGGYDAPGIMYVVRLDGRLFVKGLVYGGKDKPPVMRSTNKAFPDIVVSDGQEFKILGPVIRICSVRRPKPII